MMLFKMPMIRVHVLALSSILAVCAPDARGEVINPSPVAQGQVWVLEAEGRTVLKVTVDVAHEGAKDVKYDGRTDEPMLDGDGLANVSLTYMQGDQSTSPLLGIYFASKDGPLLSMTTCLVRQPVPALDVPQVGLFHRVSSEEMFSDEGEYNFMSLQNGVYDYITTGVIIGQTCTMTRLK